MTLATSLVRKLPMHHDSDTTKHRQHAVVADARCLQDPNFARRGVGRHTLALLQGAPRQTNLIALCDPALPPLIDEAYVLFSDVVFNAAAAPPHECFVELSPMTHDPLFVARILQANKRRKATVVYDFIPQRKPEFYLANRLSRLEYSLCLHWLSHYDLFLPISQAAAADLTEIVGIEGNRIHVTGAPVAPIFGSASDDRTRPPRHLLVVAGPDPRKNPELAIRAHALSARLQQKRVPLLIGGNYSLDILGHFQSVAAELGGDPDLVEMRASVSDETLVDMYARAYGVIAPSRDEGFSLPVVESMAAGVPCIASDIAAHRELLPEPGDRFDCNDASRLSGLLDRMVFDDAWQEAALKRQAPVWPRFRAEEVARKFWAPITARWSERPALPRPAVQRGRQPRIALLTPVPPDRSGVADYTAATCAALGKLVELDVFTETRAPSPLPGAASVRPLDGSPHLDLKYDRVISVIGNSHFHVRIFELLRHHGGVSIAHDARMLGFYRSLLGESRALEVASKELGRPVNSDELNSWLADEGLLKATFLGEVIESSSPMIVHSPVTAALLEERYRTRPPCLPFSIYRSWSEPELSPPRRRAARSRLGLSDAEVAIVSFGAVHITKAPDACIWAIEMLRSWGIPATLHFVGSIRAMHGADLRALAARLRLSRHVRFTDDYVTEEIYKDYLLASDIAVQLRTYGLGALSGAVLDCAAVGLPCVINEALADACDVPATLARRVPDRLSPLLIAEKIAELHDEGVGATRPESARRAFCEARSPAKYSLELCNTIALEVTSAPTRQLAST